MNNIEEIIKNTTEENQSKTDWTKAWSTKYPVLKTYPGRWTHHIAVTDEAELDEELFSLIDEAYWFAGNKYKM